MQLKIQPMGMTQTNCYIVTIDGKDIIIDPGMGATQWVLENTNHPVSSSPAGRLRACGFRFSGDLPRRLDQGKN